MKPPVTINDLLEEWRKDSFIDETEPGKEILKISPLRFKYLQILSYHTTRVKKLELDYKKRRHILQEYYEGNLNNKEDLETYGFTEPYVVKAGTRSKIPMMLDSNNELNDILIKKILNQEIIDVCTVIIKTLNNRSWELKLHGLVQIHGRKELVEKVKFHNLNEVYVQATCDEKVSWELREYFTFMVPGAQFSPAYRNRLWDGKIRLWNVVNKTIYRGLIPHIQKFCKEGVIISRLLRLHPR